MTPSPLRLVALLIPALLAVACSGPKVEETLRADFDASRYQRVAVVGTTSGGSTQALVDEFLLRMLGKGIDVVDSSTADAAAQKLGLGESSFGSAGHRAKVGRELDVQGMLVINYASDGKLVLVNAKLFDVESGDLAWMGSGEGTVNAGMAGVAGAVVGAGIGYKLGGGGGAAVGGIVTGRAAGELAPKALETAKEVVNMLVGKLPLN